MMAYPCDPVHAHNGQRQDTYEGDGTHYARVIHTTIHNLSIISIVFQQIL